MGDKLRVGVLIDSYQIPNWVYVMIEEILASDYAEIGLIIERDSSGIAKKIQYANIGEKIATWVISSYLELDEFFNRLEPNAFELKDLHPLVRDIPCIAITPISTRFSASFSMKDCEKIGAYALDVIVAIGFGPVSGQVLSCAQYGIWSYRQGGDGINPAGPAGLRQFFERSGDTGPVLKILAEGCGKEIILCRSYAQTDTLSVCRYNNNNYWKTAAFVLRNLRELHTLGEKQFFARIQQNNQHPLFYSRGKNTAVKMSEWIGWVLRHFQRIISMMVHKVFYFNQYILLFDVNKCGEFSSTVSNYKKIIPPYDRFWADPFVVYENRKYYIFIEEVTSQINRGHISCFTIDEDGNTSVPKMIIEKPYHMSYPFIFSYDNEYYMIPETSENRTIDLYKCIDFPEKWEIVTTIMDNIDASDVTMFQRDGKWWLFATVCENQGTPSNDELFLFYSEDLFSNKWTAHVKNPIVADVKSARPAGKIFAYNGNVYRPSQNSSKRYGYGVKINHIVALSETEYKEECISDIEPRWDKEIIAVHTLNFVNGLTMIDGLMTRARYPSDIWRYFRRRWCSNS